MGGTAVASFRLYAGIPHVRIGVNLRESTIMSSLRDFKVIQATYFYNSVTPSELNTANPPEADEIIIEWNKLNKRNPEGVIFTFALLIL